MLNSLLNQSDDVEKYRLIILERIKDRIMITHLKHIKEAKRIVIKVGSSTLSHGTGKLNLRRMDCLVRVLSDMMNSGREVILVTSGAQAAGVSKLGLKERPKSIREKQAAASVGQCDLMYIYDKLFTQYGHTVSQLLLTKDVTENEIRCENVVNTMETLLEYKIIPIVNENDTVAVDEIVYGDNDTLSAVTAKIMNADLLVLLTDIDGLYDCNPQENVDAKLIPVVEEITDEIAGMAGDSISGVGTGGMVTKIHAARIAVEKGIDVIIANGDNPERLYDILDGRAVGTLFLGKDK